MTRTGTVRSGVVLIATAAVATIAGAAASAAVAYRVAVPWLFLSTGAAAASAVWLRAYRLVSRCRGAAPGRWFLVVGLVGVAAWLVAVQVPLGDPTRPPPDPPGVGFWSLSDGARLRYGLVRASGDSVGAAPLVVVHGGPGVPDLAGQLGALRSVAADGRDVWAYEQRGSGLSSRLTDPRGYTTARAIDDLEEVRSHIDAPRLVLLGHSYGAFVVAAYLAAHPDRVEKVVFSSPGDLTEGGLGGRPQQRLDWGSRLRLYGLLASPRALTTYALVQVNPAAAHALAGDRELDARQDRAYAATSAALHCPGQDRRPPPGAGFYANQVPQALRSPAAPDLRHALGGSHPAVLILKGQCDYLDWGSAVGYLRTFPTAVLTYLPGAGHDAYLDRTDLYSSAVRAFLDGSAVPGVPADPYHAPAGYQP